MAFIFVQLWGFPAHYFEYPMGDNISQGSRGPSNLTSLSPNLMKTASRHSSPALTDGIDMQGESHQYMASGQYQGAQPLHSSQMQQPRYMSASARQTVPPSGLNQQPSPFMNLGQLGNALPDYGYPQGFPQSQSHAPFQSPYQVPHASQYPGPSVSFIPQPQAVVGGQHGQRGFQHMQNMAQQFYQFPQPPQQMSPYFYQQGQYPSNLQLSQGSLSQASFERVGYSREGGIAPVQGSGQFGMRRASISKYENSDEILTDVS